MKFKLKINQLHLNYLAMASDVGKLSGWCSGVLLLYLPKWIVLFMAAFIGLFAYGLQWLIIQRAISLPYFVVFFLCSSAGASITWFNTVCFLLCIENFPENWPLAVSLSVSFNGVSAALYNIIVKKLSPNNKNTSYLILNAVIPLITAIAALVPILQQPGSQKELQIDENVNKDDAYIFVCMYILAAFTGLYLYFVGPASQNIFVVALLLVVLPLLLPITVYSLKRVYLALQSKKHPVEGPSYNLVETKHQQLEAPSYSLVEMKHEEEPSEESSIFNDNLCGFHGILAKDRLRVLGEEHTATYLVTRCDFWLYYIAYFCGGTIGLVYNNNLGQICQSLGYISETKALVTIYSTCSFLGRLFSAAADLVGCFYHQTHMYTARTGRLTLAIVPIPIAFLVLVLSDSKIALHTATGLMGISCGFLISTAISITSELFGSKSSGINHNILITNIPLGSLLYGLLAALIYDSNIDSSNEEVVDGSKVCIGRRCYNETFGLWGCISFVGFASSFLLFLRTKAAYEEYYNRRNRIPEEGKILLQDDDECLI
ncbi:Major facilitator superfamily domain, general substrate transporter [Cynara cardunculus var. scolymus]|uniref:Major facilitator superfamily domain, general substrate transporter n=1 Tax=Cynara cardunculus var. scolymus TaxID=59895 RepID=A0A118JT60_CYNCS|nr:Major facilitator superfamily domain, general substrate transporter [Cynara cardunculus var. scolymus]